MADITWPVSGGRAFMPAGHDETLEFDVELTVKRNGRISTLSLPGARWRSVLQFDEESMQYLREQRRLVAFLRSLRGGADRLLLWNLLTPEPLGTMRGTVTAAAAASAGAASLQIRGGVAAPNTLFGSGFEIDTNSDGVADGWAAYSAGTVSGVTYGQPLGNGSPLAQRVTATTLGASSNDHAGIKHIDYQAVSAGALYSLAADVICNYSTLQVRLHVEWYTAGDVYLSSSGANHTSPVAWQRLSLAGMVAPPTAAKATVYVWMQANSAGSANPQIYVDNIQFEPAANPTAYAGLPTLLAGDYLGVNGQRIAVESDVLANDAGAATVAFKPNLREAVSSGAAITLIRPTTRYVQTSPLVVLPQRGDRMPGFSFELVEA